jgi:hypothetical protein
MLSSNRGLVGAVITLLLLCIYIVIALNGPKLTLSQSAKPTRASEFKEYVESFEALTGSPVTVSIQFESDFSFKRTELGYALLDAKRPYQASIYIKRSAWASLGPMQRRGLIWHELAHSLYGSDHNSEVGLDGCALSLMHSKAIEEQCWVKHEDYYTSELVSLKKYKGTDADVYVQLRARKR